VLLGFEQRGFEERGFEQRGFEEAALASVTRLSGAPDRRPSGVRDRGAA
jgi:hypothetical protein